MTNRDLLPQSGTDGLHTAVEVAAGAGVHGHRAAGAAHFEGPGCGRGKAGRGANVGGSALVRPRASGVLACSLQRPSSPAVVLRAAPASSARSEHGPAGGARVSRGRSRRSIGGMPVHLNAAGDVGGRAPDRWQRLGSWAAERRPRLTTPGHNVRADRARARGRVAPTGVLRVPVHELARRAVVAHSNSGARSSRARGGPGPWRRGSRPARPCDGVLHGTGGLR